MAVLVVVEEGTAGVPAEAGLQQAGFFGDLSKRAVAVVAEKGVLAVVADEKIVPAIVVVVADTAGLAPAGAGEAGFLRDIGEGAVAIVLEEMADRFLSLGKSLKAPAVVELDVEPVVLVVVKEGRATACGFKQVFVAVFATEDGFDVEAGLFGNVRELDTEGRAYDGRRLALGRRAGRRFIGRAGNAGGFLCLRLLLAGKAECGPSEAQEFL
jgi:hypothetical protein